MLDVDAEIKKAMKGQNRTALTCYRSLKTKIGSKMTEAGRGEDKTLSGQEVRALIAREIKERKESNEYLKPEQEAYQENARIVSLLEAHLPAKLSPEEQETAIRKTLEEVNPTGPKDMGRVMAALRQVEGLDMAAASAIVKKLLQEQG